MSSATFDLHLCRNQVIFEPIRIEFREKLEDSFPAVSTVCDIAP